jgi:hypothetical protein
MVVPSLYWPVTGTLLRAAFTNNNTLFKYRVQRVQRVFEKEDHEVIPI